MEVEELNNERKRQKLSVAELAEKANLPKATVEKILFGIVKHPRIDTMQAIERALGLNAMPQWTEADEALGAGKYPTFLTDKEQEWLELISEVKRVKGEDYLKTLETMIKAVIDQK